MRILEIITGSIAAVSLIAAAAFGQMGGGMMGEGIPGSTQREGTETPRMMSQDMMQNMTGVMTQMSGMLQKLSHPMGHMTVTEHARLQDMSRIMREMAISMTDLAFHMDKGKIDKATAARIQEQMDAINKALEGLDGKGY